MTKHLYKSGPLSVTEKMLRFRGRRYSISKIENLILRRPLFVAGIAVALLIGAFVRMNQDILFQSEMILFGTLAALVVGLSWPFGTLTIHSRTLGTAQGSITYLYGRLAQAQETVEGVLEQNEGESNYNQKPT